MSVLRAKLVRLKRELGNCIRNHCGIVSRDAKVVVVDSVYAEIVVTRACAADRPTYSLRSSGGRNHIGSQYGQIQRAPIKHSGGTRKIGDILRAEVVRQV